MPQTDYWGEALKSVKVDSVEECCFECRKAVNVGRPEEAVDCNGMYEYIILLHF